jgi:hypothetical protein
MTTYYTITDGSLVDLSAEQYAGMQANGKAAALLRLWVPVAAPVPSATQRVREIAPVITATTATQTWQLRDKTANELEAESLLAERAQIDAMLTDIAAQRSVDRPTWDALTANQLRAEQWRDRQILLRFVNFMARRVKQEIAS